MKYRLDFVTNSSSSSYICEICGESEHAWETPDWLIYCENEHLICEEHLIDGECPICNFQTYSQDEMANYLLKTREISRDIVFADIKKVNKRRKKLYNSEYIQYVFSQFNLTEDIILEEIKNKFNNWEEYINYLWR